YPTSVLLTISGSAAKITSADRRCGIVAKFYEGEWTPDKCSRQQSSGSAARASDLNYEFWWRTNWSRYSIVRAMVEAKGHLRLRLTKRASFSLFPLRNSPWDRDPCHTVLRGPSQSRSGCRGCSSR